MQQPRDREIGTLHWFVGLWALPILAFVLAKARFPTRVGLLTGVSLGAIVSPASLGLYALIHANAFLALLGLVGLMLSLFHGAPGYHLALRLGVVPAATVVEGGHALWVELLNGVVWSSAYGTAGSVLDWLRGGDTGRGLASD